MKPALAIVLFAVALHSPKHSEHVVSLGKPMARVSVIPGFSITNISVSASSVTLSWQGGTAPFYVLGMPDLGDHW